MNIQDHPQYKNRLTDPAQLEPGKVYRTFDFYSNGEIEVSHWIFIEPKKDERDWGYAKILTKQYTPTEAISYYFRGIIHNSRSFTAPVNPKSKRKRRTQPIVIEAERVILNDSECYKIVFVSALSRDKLPESYWLHGKVPYLVLFNDARGIGLEGFNRDGNYRQIMVGNHVSRELFQSFLEFVKHAGERLTQIRREEREQKKRARWSGRKVWEI